MEDDGRSMLDSEVEAMTIEGSERNEVVTPDGETRQNRAGATRMGGAPLNFPDQVSKLREFTQAEVVGRVGPVGVERMVPGMRVFLERTVDVPGTRVDQRDVGGMRIEVRAYSQTLRDALKAVAPGDLVRVRGSFAKREWRGRDGGWKQVVFIDAEAIEGVRDADG